MSKYECFNEIYAKIIDPTDVDASIIKEFDNIEYACDWFESELERHGIDTIGYIDEVFPLEEITEKISNDYPNVEVDDTIGEFGSINISFNHHKLVPSDPLNYVKTLVNAMFTGETSFTQHKDGSVDIDIELESETINDE
jgi:hypothetical protein